MATPVPYQGAPTAQPIDRPIEPERIDTPYAAFGGLVAEATQHLGQVTDQASDELFARGYAMQQMNQQAEADKASADYANSLTQSYLDYTQKRGNDAVQAFPAFAQSTEDMRTQAAGNLNSPYAQLMFNQESRNFRSRVMFSAGIHAREQNQAFVQDGLNARMAAGEGAIGTIPDDDAAFQQGLASQKQLALEASINKSGVQDPNDPINQQAVAEAASRFSSIRLQSLAKTAPFAAQKELDKLTQSHDISSLDAQRVGEFIDKQRWTTGARAGATTVLAGNNNQFGEGIIPDDKILAGIKAVEGGKYNYYHPEVQFTNKEGQTGTPLGAYQVMSYNLSPWLKLAGMQDMTPQQFTQNPQAQDQLATFMLRKYQQDYGSANKAAAKWLGALDKNGNYTNARDAYGTGAGDYLSKFNGGIARASSLGDLVNAGQQWAEKQSPGDNQLPVYVAQEIERQYNETQAIQRNDEFNNKQTVYAALNGGASGKIPTSLADLRADPKVGAALDAMHPTDQHTVLNVLAHNAKGDYAMTQEGLATYGRLYGEALNQPDKFVNEDIISQKLPWATRKDLLQMQQKVFAKSFDNPQVNYALGHLAPMLGSAGLTKQEDPDGYNDFTGALHGEMEDFIETHKRMPRDDDLDKIGARLLQRSGGGWFSSGTPLYGSLPPDEYTAMANKAFDAQGVPAGDQRTKMIQQMWVRQQYQRLYGKTDLGPGVPNE